MNLLKKLNIKYFLFVLIPFFFLSCADFFQGKVGIDNSGSTSSLYDLLTPAEKILKLDAPKELFVSQNLYSGKIEISWSSVRNASSYKLERAIVSEKKIDGTWQMPDESDFEILTSSNIYNTYYTDTIIQNPLYTSPELNYVYYYRVIAQNLSKGYDESDYYPDYEQHKIKDEDGVETGDVIVYANPDLFGCLLQPPYNIEASKGLSTDSITIKWKSVPNVSKYKIYRGDRENGVFYSISELYSNETEYTDEIEEVDQGVEFYYKVYAENRVGNLSSASSVAMGYSLKEGAPSAPSSMKVDNGFATSTSGITVSWSEAVSTGGVLTYSLYRTSSIDSVYKLIKSDISGSYSYTDTSAKPNVYYYYFIQTISTKGEEVLKSAFSDSGASSAEPAYGYLLSAPSIVEINDGTDSSHLRIRWQPAINTIDSEDSVDFTYNIRTDSDVTGYFDTIIASEVKGTSDSEGYLYYDVPIVEGQDFFVVTTVNANGNDKESLFSTIVAPVPDAPMNVCASKTISVETAEKNILSKGGSFDSSIWVENKNEVYPVLITWDKSDKAVGYNIYRSTKKDSGFKKINENQITDLFFIDSYTAAKSGTFYYYKVFSLNSLAQGRKSNNPAIDAEHEARGYGAITLNQWFREYNKTILCSLSKLTLMHKSSDLDKVGSESINGSISGYLSYNAAVQGLGAEITMHYSNYADHFINDDNTLGIRFILEGNTDTTSNMSANGNMHEVVQCYTKNIDLTDSNSIGSTFERLSDAIKSGIINTGDTKYQCGMYPGYVIYNNLQIKGGAAGGGYYLVQTYELDRVSKSTGTIVIPENKVDWLIGEEK